MNKYYLQWFSAQRVVALLFSWALFLFIGCNSDSSSKQAKDTVQVKETKTGLASFYSHSFEGKETASGDTFHVQEMTAAHPTYPLGTLVRVTNLEKGNAINVRITDRGPTQPNRKEGVIIDLSKGAAQKLDMVEDGRADVKVEVLEWGNDERK